MSANNNNNKDNTSTLQSYVDSATGAIQSAIGSVTGNTGDQNAGDSKQSKAQAESDASHAGASVLGYDVSAQGVHKQNSDRSQGQWDETIGGAKKTLGGLVGSEDLKASGARQEQQGTSQKAAGQGADYLQGVGDRVTGTVGGALSGLTGNTGAQAEYQQQHDTGKAAQRGVEAEINKEADAQAKAAGKTQ